MSTMVQHAPSQTGFDWAYSEDIPGSRTDPEDGPWPRSYQILEEDGIWRELRMLAKPQTFHFDTSRGWRADCINFQPSPSTRTQDRYVVKQLEINGRQWSLTGVFDGHLGDVTVEHVSHHLPIIVQELLQKAFENEPSRLSDPAFISESFSRSITAFDDAIAGDVLNLFGGIEGLSKYSDAQIRQIINDQHSGGANYTKARLNMYGTTALVALVDPDYKNLWIANLGDCKAILVSPKEDDEWEVNVLTRDHNGDNDAEVERVHKEHPGEPDCVIDRRVLGALAPFRALGDTPFKQPPEFTRRILFNLLPGFQDTTPWEEFLARNRTPPYISSEPEITHCSLDMPQKKSIPGPRFLILSSDGLSDLCQSEGQQKIISDWAKHVVAEKNGFNCLFNSSSRNGTTESNINNILPTYPMSPTSPTAPGAGSESRNMALRLLRRALGGEDKLSVSKVLTLDMDDAWIDDTAIVVQTL
ncbi:protein serine/threonine phosphatase 2C [Marasmius fiardii PR-910]|nr:protein serine/threonine phosphatase 2C [Marasmius fiardii PR-910]